MGQRVAISREGGDGDFCADVPLGWIFRAAQDFAIQGVAFHWLASAFPDQGLNLFDREQFGGGGPRIVVDQLVAHGAIEIVGAVFLT